jgi:hypothetical protein
MQVKTADTYRNDRISPLLMAAAMLLGALAFAKVAAFYVERGRMQGIACVAKASCDPNDLKGCLEQAKKAADAIKGKNLFIKEPPKEHPVKQVDGILGNEAFIAGKWYKAGDKVGDAKIVEIRPTYVKVEWEGKTTSLAPIGAAIAESSPPPAAKQEAKKETPTEAKKGEAKTEGTKVETPVAVEENDPLGWLGVTLSPKLKAFLMEKWNAASDEEKAKAQEEWNRMSDSDKQKAIDQMEQGMDSMGR